MYLSRMSTATKTLTLQMPVDLYRVTAKTAKKRRMSLNSFILEGLEAKRQQEQAKTLFDSFTKLGKHAAECDVEYAVQAQREVVGHDA